MYRHSLFVPGLLVFGLVSLSVLSSAAPNGWDSQEEFFEKKIRPVLVDQCYECHNTAKSQEGGLALDHKAGLVKGGNGGPLIVAGKSGESRLLAILRHEVEGVKMPQGGAKLSPQVIQDFERWIENGAFDPRNRPPTPAELEKSTSWDSIRDRRKSWWSFQPILDVPVPIVEGSRWSKHPVDQFILSKLLEKGLKPSGRAGKRTLLRRATFALTGLPPTPSETDDFLKDNAPDAYEKVIDRLLASPRFGEHWARHWMDLVRYCESHGSQGDPELPNAWRYRDYLIRAFNQDLPYDQMIREQIAGDLFPKPRIHPTGEWNESVIGPAHFRMVEYGYVPVDALEDQVKVVDNQIDVFSKAFLGLTISCARCHDHKFDPISQKDFYALYGVFASCRPGQVLIDSPDRLQKNRAELTRIKDRIRGELADAWQTALPEMIARFQLQETQLQESKTLKTQSQKIQSEIDLIEQPARAALLKANGKSSKVAVPRPFAKWSFSRDARDSEGTLHGQIEGTPVFRGGRMVLNGKDVRVRTKPIPKEIREKTFETWITLANLDQRAVGVISLESDEGEKFDSIVYSEIDPGVWIAGSDFFNRTKVNGGQAEKAAPDQLIHLAIVYQSDHHIAIYRDGKPYGSVFTKGPIQPFPAGKGRILFGQRHPAPGIPYMAGEIDEARLYDRALTPGEIAASFIAGPDGVTREEVIQFLPPETASRLKSLYQDQDNLTQRLQSLEKQQDPWQKVFTDAHGNQANPMHVWSQLIPLAPSQWGEKWTTLAGHWEKEWVSRKETNQKNQLGGWDLTSGDYARWNPSGTGLTDGPSNGGNFSIARDGDRIVKGIYPAGVFTHGLSRKHNGVLTSPRFQITTDNISIRALGENSTARVVIENYAIGNGGIYPATRLDRDEMGWMRLDTSYRKGSHAYIEFTTDENDQAFFGAGQVVFHQKPDPPRDLPIRALLQKAAPVTIEQLAQNYSQTLLAAIHAFRAGNMSSDEVAFLDFFVRNDLLPAKISQLPNLRQQVETYRKTEKEITLPQRAPGLYEGEGLDQHLFKKGRHTQPMEPVPHRYLEVFGARPFPGKGSGRMQLAQEVASPVNPLTGRVMVNRLWHHLFGRGIVSTVDNFGRLGETPTHPELLDYLAFRFSHEANWSIKKMLRLIMTSETYQQSAIPTPASISLDPGNLFLSHKSVRRLEAESIRDAILATSGQLDFKMYGPGVNVYFVSKTEGGGPKGPLDGDRRRTVYQRTRRNASNPFLEVFDAPKPSTTRGKRDTTNVPAQSLAMLNDPFVIDQAAKWAKSLVKDGKDVQTRIRMMYVAALNREPDDMELRETLDYVKDLAGQQKISDSQWLGNETVWRDLAQSLFCLKEFIYVD